MCNLSEGVLEKGIEIGEKRGKAQAGVYYISNMYQIGFSIEDIAKVSQMSKKDVLKIIKENVRL